jgi:hypothetical protein
VSVSLTVLLMASVIATMLEMRPILILSVEVTRPCHVKGRNYAQHFSSAVPIWTVDVRALAVLEESSALKCHAVASREVMAEYIRDALPISPAKETRLRPPCLAA